MAYFADVMADVDDLGVAADAEHHAAAGGGRAIQSEVGQEGDDGSLARSAHPSGDRAGDQARVSVCRCLATAASIFSSDRMRDRERLGRVGIAVDDEDGLRPSIGGEMGEPRLQLVLVGVSGKTGDGTHAAADVDLLAIDSCRLPAVLEAPAQGPLALVADEQQRAASDRGGSP